MAEAIMVDIETLSTRSNALILSIGAARFEIGKPVTDTFYVNIDAKDARSYGLHVSKDTVQWWQRQKPEALKATQSDCKPLREAMESFVEWCSKSPKKTTEYYANGTNFDFPIIQWSLQELDIPVPWEYYNMRDARTLYAFANLNMFDFPRVGTYHNALDDVLTQIKALEKIFED